MGDPRGPNPCMGPRGPLGTGLALGGPETIPPGAGPLPINGLAGPRTNGGGPNNIGN